MRSVFSSIVTTPPETFGKVTSNLPRVRQSELLTPAELMVLLHESEKEIGLKSAIEGELRVSKAGEACAVADPTRRPQLSRYVSL